MTEQIGQSPSGLEITRRLIKLDEEIRTNTRLIGSERSDFQLTQSLRALDGKKNGLLISLLNLRRDQLLDARVILTTSLGETIHPFSKNKVELEVSFDELNNGNPNHFETILSDLRKEGQINDSRQAWNLLGSQVAFSAEDRSDFIARSIEEIFDIRTRKAVVSKYESLNRNKVVNIGTVRELKDLEELLVIDRFLTFVYTPIGAMISAHRVSGEIVVNVRFNEKRFTTKIDPNRGNRTEEHKQILASIP